MLFYEFWKISLHFSEKENINCDLFLGNKSIQNSIKTVDVFDKTLKRN